MTSPAERGAPLLQARHLSKRFGTKTALEDVSLSVFGGQVYALLGANGAGKTTLINLLLGFLQADAGRCLIDGHDVGEDVQHARRLIGYIPEQVMLYPALSGVENLDYFSRLAGHRLSQTALLDFLVAAGLERQAAAARVSSYSKGMRQKVGIAIAVAKNARVLLLDEPTSGLDPHAANEFMQLIAAARSRGTAVLMTTHDLFHAQQVANRVGIMRAGKLVIELDVKDVEDGSLQRLYLEQMRMAAAC